MTKKNVHKIIVAILIGFFVLAFLLPLVPYNTPRGWDFLTTTFFSEEAKHAKIFVDNLHKSQIRGVQDQIHPGLLWKLVEFERSPTVIYFYEHQPQAVWLLGYHKFLGSEGSRQTYVLQYDFVAKPGANLLPFFGRDFSQTDEPYSLLITVQEQEKNNSFEVVAIRIDPLSSQEKQMGQFLLKGKSAFQIAFLIVSILIPLFIIFSLVQFVRMPASCQKKRWLAFIAVGLVGFTLDWATGDISVELIHAQLIGSGAFKSGMYAPWIISASVPLGALLFFFKRKKWLAEYQSNIEAQSSSIL